MLQSTLHNVGRAVAIHIGRIAGADRLLHLLQREILVGGDTVKSTNNELIEGSTSGQQHRHRAISSSLLYIFTVQLLLASFS